jgi:hypothetical protein
VRSRTRPRAVVIISSQPSTFYYYAIASSFSEGALNIHVRPVLASGGLYARHFEVDKYRFFQDY